MASECIDCKSRNTELFRGEDGHFRKECNDCGHVGGPYVTQSKLDQEETSSSSLFDY